MKLIFSQDQKQIVTGSKEVSFEAFSSFYLIKLASRVRAEKQISSVATDDEDLIVKIDSKAFPYLRNSKRLIDAPSSFSGGKTHNFLETIYFLVFLKGKKHQISLTTDEPTRRATLESLEVYLLSIEDKLTLEIKNQAEDGNNYPWLIFVLDQLPLKSFTSTVTYSRRGNDSDDVKIKIDGKTIDNLLRTIKHFLWRYVGSRIIGTKHETETFITNFPPSLHYLEFWADRRPTLNSLTLNLGNQPVTSGVPTLENPRWGGDFADDTEEMLLARTLYGEVGGESKEAKIAVAWTIRNRVEDSQKRWGQTYHEVILLPSQYDALWNNLTYDKVRNPLISDFQEKQAWEESFQIASEILKGKIKDSTNGANHFYSTTIAKPNWAKEENLTVQIGETRFYKL